MTVMRFLRPAALAGLSALALAPLLAQDASPSRTHTAPPARKILSLAGPPSGASPSWTTRRRKSSRCWRKSPARIALRAQDLPQTKFNFSSGRELTRREAETAIESTKLAWNGIVAARRATRSCASSLPGRGGQPAASPAPALSRFRGRAAGERPPRRPVVRAEKRACYATLDAAIQQVVNKTRRAPPSPCRARTPCSSPIRFQRSGTSSRSSRRSRRADQVLCVPLENTRSGTS